MTRIAGATFSFGDLTLEQSASLLAGLGFAFADVGAGWSNYQQVSPRAAADDPDREAARLRRVMEANGLAVSELFLMQFEDPINHPDVAARRATSIIFDQVTTFAAKAGFESVMMIPGQVHEDLGQEPREAFDTSAEALRSMVGVAQDKGLACNIEPCMGSVAHEPTAAIALCEAVPGLGLTLDYAHQVQLDLDHEQIEPMHRYARHMHAKPSAPGTFQVPADESVIDFPRIVRKLEADRYDGVFCVEYVTSQAVLDAGWDVIEETAKLKGILEDALRREKG
ncbi:MAG: hypothetical protein CMJ18_02085 [Phycisphaeraceae bacterium]|nr:hypothetical protein [Phycisphaeraceae bacterium]